MTSQPSITAPHTTAPRTPAPHTHAPAQTPAETAGCSSRRLLRESRGDVPGWVLITLMTAGLVIVIWAVAGPALSSVFDQAILRVTGF